VRLAAVAAVFGLVAGIAVVGVVVPGEPVAPAWAAAGVAVVGPDGTARADVAHSTTLTLTGSGFQSIPGGFGGVYVLFGWVNDPAGGAWKPSQGGTTGRSYRYVPDVQDRQNAGYERFVSFPGSDTASSANGGLIAADGTWSTSLVVPGPTFQAVDADGAVVTTDCRLVQCGVITIGAHGVVNPSNETFTPVAFVDLSAASSDGTAGSSGGSGAEAAAGSATGSGSARSAVGAGAEAAGSTPTGLANTGRRATAQASPRASAKASAAVTGSASGASGEAPVPSTGVQDAASRQPTLGAADLMALPQGTGDAPDRAPATLGIDPTTAVAGHAMSFTAQGLDPGEQVVVVLDDGVLAQGPLPVGEYGEVAGILELPTDLRVGTHVLRLTGAASGLEPAIEITVRKDPATVEAAEALAAQLAETDAADPSAATPQEIAVGVALLALLAVIVSGLATAQRRRRTAPRGAGGTPPGGRGPASSIRTGEERT
jgi:hypothetical protein